MKMEWMKKHILIFTVLFSLIPIQHIIPAAPAEDILLSLSSKFTPSNKIENFRHSIAKRVKGLIRNRLDHQKGLSNKLKQEAIQAGLPIPSDLANLITIVPLKAPHYTHLLIGDISKRAVQCIQNALKEFFNQTISGLIHPGMFTVTMQENTLLKLLEGKKAQKKYFIVFLLNQAMNDNWNTVTQVLNAEIESKCNIRLSHFRTYQEDPNIWLPHVSLLRIEANPQIDLQGLFEMPYMFQGHDQTLKGAVQGLIQQINQENAQKGNALDTLMLDTIMLGSPTETLATFAYNRNKNSWDVTEKAEEVRPTPPPAQPIRFKPQQRTPYFSFSNTYDGSPGADSLIPGGVRGYKPGTGLELVIDNAVYKTAQDYYAAMQKQFQQQWDARKDNVMETALRAKFIQHDDLRQLLLGTGNSMIINASEHPYWGSGKNGQGQNQLGILLMKIRGELLGQ